MCRLIDRLEILEKECGIAIRWKADDQQYKYYLNRQTARKRNQLRQRMWSAVVKRQFLLEQKAKYGGKSFSILSVYCGIILNMQMVKK